MFREAAHWHQITNHAPAKLLQKLSKNPQSVVLSSVAAQILSQMTCSTCMSTNQPRGPNTRTTHEYELAEALSSDSCGPLPEVGIGGEHHFVTFIDVATRFAAAIPIISRDESPELIDVTFNNFIRDYGRTPKIFVSDNAKEYVIQKTETP